MHQRLAPARPSFDGSWVVERLHKWTALSGAGPQRRRALSTLVGLAVSGGILWWLVAEPATRGLMARIAHADLAPLVLAFLLVPVIQGLRAWRFSILLLNHTSAPSWTMFAVAVRLILFNFLLPFKLGEATFPMMARRAFGTAISHAVGALALVRLLDLGVVAALVLLAAALALPESARVPHELLITGGALVLGLTILLPSLVGMLRRAACRLGWPLLERVLDGGATIEHPAHRLLVILSTLAIWLVQALVGWLAAHAAIDGIGLAATTFAAASANLAFALPVPTIAGLGPPQAAWVMALDVTAVPWAAAVANALTCHAVQFFGALTLGLATVLAPTGQGALEPCRRGS